MCEKVLATRYFTKLIQTKTAIQTLGQFYWLVTSTRTGRKITNTDIITMCFPISKKIPKFSPNLIISDESSWAISSPDMHAILHEASLFLGTNGCWLQPFSRWRLWTLLSEKSVLSHTETIQLLAEWEELPISSSAFLNNIKYKPICKEKSRFWVFCGVQCSSNDGVLPS